MFHEDFQYKFEDTKGWIRILKSKDRQYNGQKTKGQTRIYKTLHRKSSQHEPHFKPRDELRCFRRISSSCSHAARHVTLVTNQAIKSWMSKDRIAITTNGTFQWSFVTQIFVLNSASVASLLAATLYLGNHDRNKLICKIYQVYSICRCCWNVATYNWKVQNGKIEIISFNVKFRS